jgi:uncharacterized protein (DUF433 family)
VPPVEVLSEYPLLTGGTPVAYLFVSLSEYQYAGHIMDRSVNRITVDPAVMGGKPCLRGMRVTVGTVVGLLAAGRTQDEVLAAYPYLEREDILAALAYAAWRSEEIDVPVATS